MSTTKKKDVFTAEEKAAMRARAKELKSKEDGESAVRAALAEMSPKDRALGKRIHGIVTESAPDLELARGGDRGLVHRQLTACLRSFAILASSALVSLVNAKATGHIEPSSSFAVSLKPSIA